MRQAKTHFGLILLGQNVKQGRNREKEEEEVGEDQTKVCFHLEIKCILMSRVIGMEISCSLF